jgi:hypothetical protein
MTNVDGVDFTGNNSLAMHVREASAEESVFANCKFGAGTAHNDFKNDFLFADEEAHVTFVDCDFGNATFNNKNAAKFVGGTVSNSTGSIFGEGSLVMIVAILSLIASGVSIFLIADMKKKIVLANEKANGVKTEDEE